MVSGDPWDRAGGTNPDAERRDSLADIAREIERLESRVQAPSRQDAARDDISALAAKVRSLAERIGSSDSRSARASRPDADPQFGLLADRVREIEARAARLAEADRRSRSAPAYGAAPSRGPSGNEARLAGIDQTLREMRSRLEALRPAAPRPLGLSADAVSQDGRAETERRLRAAIAEISARQEAIDRAIGAPPPSTGAMPGEPVIAGADIKGEIARLGDFLSRLAEREQEDSKTLSRLDDRLNLLARSRYSEGGELTAMREEIARLASALDGAARETTLASVEAGYGHLIGRLDQLARDLAEAPVANLPRELGRLGDRVDELARSLPERERLNDLAVGVAQLGRAVAARETSGDFSGLEARLAGLADRLDKTIAGLPASRLDDFLSRLEAVTARLDRPALTDGPAALEALRDEVAALRQAVAGTGRPEAEALENQIRALIMRLDALPGEGDPGMAQLESQVARLADRIDQLGARPAAYGKVEENLGRLEGLLRSSRTDTLAAAKDAARAAVAEFSGAAQAGDSGPVRALKDDLRRLQAAAENADNRTQDTLDTVQQALEKVVARLAALESSPPPADDRHEDQATSPVSRWRSVFGTPERRDAESSPVGAPQPAATERGADRKADFIAAARRAAQAAAAESASLKVEVEAERKSGPLGRLGQALKSRRRPLLLAAAAIVLTLAAMQLFGGGNDKSAAVASSQPVVSADAKARPTADRKGDNTAAAAVRDLVTAAGAMGDDGGGALSKDDGLAPFPAASDAGSASADQRATAAFAPPASTGNARFGAASDTPPASGFSAPAATAAATGAPADIDRSAATAATGPVRTAALGNAAAAAPVLASAPMPDPVVGPQALRAAAASGDTNALYEVAARYAEGRDVPANSKLAVEWFRRAAERGMALAEFRLAALYERGEGIAKDRKVAADWYQKAADLGNVRAMHNLAVMVSEGLGGAPDYGVAAEWFQKAADHGVKDSQYNLGVIYARGLGRKQDLVQSYKWFALAAAQGDSDAGGRRDEVGKTLSPDQLAQARAAVQAWRVTAPLEVANSEPVPDPSWQGAASDKRTVLDRQGLVKKVQALLAERGFDPGPPDGHSGAKTKAAIKAFQARAGLAQNGEIDPTLVTALAEKSG